MAQFNKWRQTSDIGQVLDIDDALRACETRAAEGRCMPWEFRVSRTAGIPDLPWPIRDVDDPADAWSPKAKIDPVQKLKESVPRCCAACKFLVDLPKFGPPECKRPGGPRFDGLKSEMVFTRCALYRRGRTLGQVKALLDDA
jgi:hypothetical protein